MCGSVGIYGLDLTSFCMSLCDRFLLSDRSAMLFSSSCVMILNPALLGGVKNGLKVLMEKGPS